MPAKKKTACKLSEKKKLIVKKPVKKTTSPKTTPPKKKQVEVTNPYKAKKSIDLYKLALLVVVDFHKPGNSRKTDMDNIEFKVKKTGNVKVDKEMFRLNKELLDSPELEGIVNFDQKTRQFLVSLALPSPLKRGTYLISNQLIANVREYLQERQQERRMLVEEFMKIYPSRVEDAKERLQEYFDPSNYPSIDGMRSKFSMTYRIRSMFVDEDIKSLDEAIYQEEANKFAKEMTDLQTDIANTLRLGLKQALDRFLSALTTTEEGKRKKLYDSNCENLLTFLNTFDAKNIVDDDDCAALVKQAKSLVKNRGASDLGVTIRTNDDFRDQMFSGFSQIAKELETMVYDDESRDVTW